ncbi:hypothetical protein [Nonomuraea guangzhouensis]|uniref:Uncharacterized protein n=1 Tax=Nonomuraea guangzhouensis TaxID=1291555 RepID=A0ABW4H0G4_9ACTN|nr:hypothetical protein [Nonomuraea guangzhouensis]
MPYLGERVAVSLHLPPPLERDLDVRVAPRRVSLWDGEELIASASPTSMRIAPPAQPPSAAVAAAEGRYPGHAAHPFPSCFVCGVTREDEGLMLTPGRVTGQADTVACTWTPAGTVPEEIVWSVLDCPGGWTGDPVKQPAVLTWMTARIRRLPEPGDRLTVVGRLVERRPRTMITTTALYGRPARAPLASSACIWTRLET